MFYVLVMILDAMQLGKWSVEKNVFLTFASRLSMLPKFGCCQNIDTKTELDAMNLPQIYSGFTQGHNRYSMPIVATWREAKLNAVDQSCIPFTKNDIVRHGTELHRLRLVDKPLPVKNVPDIIYTFRAREELPNEIRQGGDVAIIGKGKGKYAFVEIKTPNRIRLPQNIESTTKKDIIPPWAKPYMGDDEQSTLTRVAANDLVADFLKLSTAFRLQSHRRMSVKEYGQVEVDEVYAGATSAGEHIIIGIEAKDRGGNDLLNISQLYGTAQALKSIAQKISKKMKLKDEKNLIVRLLGVKPDTSKRICIAEFKVADDPRELKQVGQWMAYDLTD